MRMVYHLGSHCTDDDKLLRCLLRNATTLRDQAVEVPPPTRYRKLLRDTAVRLRGARATDALQTEVLDHILGPMSAMPERVVLAWENFLAFPQWAIKERLYPHAGERIHAFTRIFPSVEAEFHLAIRNPATFVPALFERQREQDFTSFLAETDPMDLRWSDTIRQIVTQNPDVPLYVWCDEDAPMLWPEILARLAGVAGHVRLSAADEWLTQLLTRDGLSRYRNYVTAHPPATAQRHAQVIATFLERFANHSQFEMDVNLPGWDQDYVDDLTDAYHEDLARIRHIAGVTLLAPPKALPIPAARPAKAAAP